ncbi:hypothetical protein M407DRAFT_241022 [Tulasnella calospora MUT 4182]|uniref:Uncharacterized protein n=1 Tax=Tulasnella calospora MUT 4182 TaxID=1051891 RepID=A0A0C3LI52_9AGAM|nr:hypothetical protein M407DRAFT_241022 [Tulasnella calospora MUT 4182]
MQTFLSMYELLREVFTHADRKTTATAACSSKTLSTPALDVLWRVVPRASFLFSLLCPLEGAASYDGHSCRRFDFDRDLHPADWKRFLPYSRRVEELSCMDEILGDRWNEPSHKALAKVSSSRPADLTLADVFPRLRSLTWNVYSHKVLRNMSMFLVPSLTFLEIKIDNVVEYKPMSAFLKQLQARCAPNLRELRLNTDFAISTVEEEVLDLLKEMSRLERLILPRFWTNDRLFGVVAGLPSLQYIGQRKSYWWGNSDDTDGGLMPAIEALQKDAFPALQDITYDTLNLFESKKLFTHPHAPKQLISLCVTSNKLETPHQVQDFLSAISETLVNLQDLDIGLTFPVSDAPDHSTDVTFATLQPVTLLPKLSHFGLATHFPIKMDDAELDAWTDCAWGRRLKVLWLNETPAYAIQREIKSDLTLKALDILARNCRNLEELSIFVNATEVPKTDSGKAGGQTLEQLVLEGQSKEQVTEYKKLRYLNLGVSHISSSSNVANYIADLICTTDPEDIEPSTISPLLSAIPLFYRQRSNPASGSKPRPFLFDCSPRFWPAPVAASEFEPVLSRRRDAWDDVGKMIPALMEKKVSMEQMQAEMIAFMRKVAEMKVNPSSSSNP